MKYNYLVFDTETTGLPPRKTDKFYSIFDKDAYPEYDDTLSSSHCRLVSISWMIYSTDSTTPFIKRYFVIKPDDYVIPEKSTNIHNITTEEATKTGIYILDMFSELEKDIEQVNVRIAHNFLFDRYIIGSEMHRYKLYDLFDKWENIPSFCTMTQSMNHFDFGTTRYGNPKVPKLAELYKKVCNKTIQNAHHAEADTQACAECYQAMLELLDHEHA